MKSRVFFLCITFSVMSSFLIAAESINLSGQWRFAIDASDVGIENQWYKTSLPGDDILHLPGSMQVQGFGDAPGPSTPWTGDINESEWNKSKYDPYRSVNNFKMPFWLQPDKYYKGAAWYQKTVIIPDSWKSKHITLRLERPHWETHVWVDASEAGSANYLSVPHIYDLSDFLTPGEHTLTIRVDNRMVINVGPNSHSISDHTQSNWNGIVGFIELTAEAAVWIEDVQVYPDPGNKTIKVVAHILSRSDENQAGQLGYQVLYRGVEVTADRVNGIPVTPEGTVHECMISFSEPVQVWDEFIPNLYTLKAQLRTDTEEDEDVTVFGMRQLNLDGNLMMLNGHRVFMRGTLECCIFPKTGYPPTDVESWKHIINICKSHGLNHIRFHSWCPPEAAFIAADELGFYYQVECSSWPNQGASLGDGKPIDQWLYDEADAVLKAYGNHPSFMLFTFGNEPGGRNHTEYLKQWVTHCKQKDSRHLVTGGSGWPLMEENDFHVTFEGTRIQGWGEELKSRINSQPPETVTDYRQAVNKYPRQATISHEIGQWCVYPNFDEMTKYTGVLKTKNFEVFEDFLEDRHMADQAHDFLMASGKLQVLCYKEEIESALRTPNFGGFQLLDLHDFPGQGTALVGILDPFWDSKPYISPAEYKRFAGPVVPLARLPKRILTVSDTLAVQVDVSQFGPKDLANVELLWSLMDTSRKAVKQGVLKKDSLPAGDFYTVGDVSISLADLPVPAKYNLELAIKGTDAVNDWDVWVYPETADSDAADDVIITSVLDENTVSRLQDGANVLLAIEPSHVKTDVKLGFSSIFWNTAWTKGQAPHTLGILCDPGHPALAAFPTDYHSNWQWSEPIQNAAVMEMDHLPNELRPIVQVVPDWFEPKRLGLVFEAKVGKGAILLCSVDILGDLEELPVTRQLRYSLLTYMNSEKLRPETVVDVAALRALFREASSMGKLQIKVVKVDSYEPNYEAENAVDQNPQTLWQTALTNTSPGHPHEIQLDLGKPVVLKGISYLPRQDYNQSGWIKEYAVYVSDSGSNWGDPVARGTFEKDAYLKTIHFEQEITTRYLRFEAISGFDNDVLTAIAEIELIVKQL